MRYLGRLSADKRERVPQLQASARGGQTDETASESRKQVHYHPCGMPVPDGFRCCDDWSALVLAHRCAPKTRCGEPSMVHRECV